MNLQTNPCCFRYWGAHDWTVTHILLVFTGLTYWRLFVPKLCK